MKSRERKQHIISYVQQHQKAGPADIVLFVQKELQQDVNRVTVSRYLSQLVKEGALIKEGKGPSTTYTVSPAHVVNTPIDVNEYFAVAQDDRPARTSFNFDIFGYLHEPLFTEEEHKKLSALHQKFQSKIQNIESETLREKEFERIMIEFSWKSSQIEGNTYSLLDTEVLLKEHRAAAGKTAKETQMILNHKEVFQFIREHAGEFSVLSRKGIEEVHRILIQKLGIRTGFRNRAVGITGTNYRPLGIPAQIEEAMAGMIVLINEKDNFFEKALITLALIAYIQPFEDGNKRVGRTVSNAILLAHDSVPLSYRAVDEVEYKKAKLLFYEIQNLSYLKKLFIEQFTFSVEQYF